MSVWSTLPDLVELVEPLTATLECGALSVVVIPEEFWTLDAYRHGVWLGGWVRPPVQEVEFSDEAGERELLQLGEEPPVSILAPLLPAGVDLAGAGAALFPPDSEGEEVPAGESLAGEPDSAATAVGDPTHFFYDPDPAVGRASLIDVLAERLDAHKLNEQVAYLIADERISTPFARRFRILAWLPFSERRLYEQLQAMGASRVEVMRRASPVDTNALERRLNEALAGGDDVMTVALTLLHEQRVALVLERERD